MSCQQASRLITILSTSSVTPEDPYEEKSDPYVFTESVPTTPPILFNTQKSRSRLTEQQPTTETATTATTNTTKTTANQKIPLAQLNGNGSKAQASFAAAATAGTITTNRTPTTSFKNVTQSQKQPPPPTLPQLQQQSKRIATNVAGVHQHQPQYIQQQQHKQQQPPPLLQHTPSLWQTPLLLETCVSVVLSPQTSPAASLPSPASPSPATLATMVAPLVTSPSAAAPLPPSKFHHTTLAQHLQKVQCIKKPKKSPTPAVISKQHDVDAMPQPPPLQTFDQPQHSVSDLNEIPVNVIFRKPHITNEITRTLLSGSSSGGGSEEKEEPAIGQSVGPIITGAAATTTAAATSPIGNKLKNVKIITPTLKATTPPPPPPTSLSQHTIPALKDIVFVQPNIKHDVRLLPPPIYTLPPIHDTSSNALQQKRKSDCSKPASKCTYPLKDNNNKLEKSLQTDTATAPKLSTKAAYKRKLTSAASSAKIANTFYPFGQKKSRKSSTGAFFFMGGGERAHVCSSTSPSTAVAVIKMTAAQVDADISLLASSSVLPYCVQRHWLGVYDALPNIGREERIAHHKSLLRRQAVQLLATRSLQKLPLQAARRRLLCVDRLLRKYQNHCDDHPDKKCVINACMNSALELASHCHQHITNNVAQHIFMPCTAKFADNTQCRIPVFDIAHDLPLCTEHARKRDAYNRTVYEQRPRKLSAAIPFEEGLLYRQQEQKHQAPHMQTLYTKKENVLAKPNQSRKRKATNTNSSAGRTPKRVKKATIAAVATATTPPPLSAVLHRKSSTTSLESIASNSHSSSSQPHPQQQQQQQQHYMPNSSLAPPALAPLSGVGIGSGSNVSTTHRMLNFGATAAVASDLNAHEINQIVAQFSTVAANNNNNNSYNFNNNHNNMNFINTNSNSNFGSGLGSSSSLPSTDELLSICENSSAYASSEDTGLGGLSETELMAHDADEIPLADTCLLQEHDLTNVLSALPVDAFNELFNAVHQDEYDEVERALELADKHLKSLQQTIGSDSDFLGDFLDVNDEILADADMSIMHSPDTSGIDTATLFIDSSSGAGGGGSSAATSNCPNLADIRGLVQT